jgi:16S rRNA (adenine1518-N6/adenine1519-N6)-dimethyltransferase
MAHQRKSGGFAKKSLGQNFLIDPNVVDKIVAAVVPTASDVILEIGPGRGALTQKLLERAGKLFALEFDRDLVPLLRERFAKSENFVLIEDDALSFDFRKLDTGGEKLRLVANLPYNISTAILQRLFDLQDAFSDCVLMFQREVAERITAEPGNSERGFLTVMTEAHYRVERLFDVPPAAFRPVPKVWSSVVRLTPRKDQLLNGRHFRDLVSTGFAQKRKTILNNLKSKYPDAGQLLESSGIDPKRRAETLSVEEWIELARIAVQIR